MIFWKYFLEVFLFYIVNLNNKLYIIVRVKPKIYNKCEIHAA